MKTLLLTMSFICVLTARAELDVTVSSLKITGQKAVVPLVMQNHFDQKIESARATVFLLDEKGKTVGQSTKWVIGGTTNHANLAPGATNIFYFVITSEKPITTSNLTAKAVFNRVVLDGGRLANPNKNVQIQETTK